PRNMAWWTRSWGGSPLRRTGRSPSPEPRPVAGPGTGLAAATRAMTARPGSGRPRRRLEANALQRTTQHHTASPGRTAGRHRAIGRGIRRREESGTRSDRSIGSFSRRAYPHATGPDRDRTERPRRAGDGYLFPPAP